MTQFQVWSEEDDTRRCFKCGSSILPGWDYCPKCGAPADVEEYVRADMAARAAMKRAEEKARAQRKARLVEICIALAGLAAFAYLFFGQSSDLPANISPAPVHTAQPAKISAPEPSVYLSPVPIKNGDQLSWPTYVRNCPFTVSVPSGSNNYYIYLRYLYAPSNSIEARKPITDINGIPVRSATEDISFYVEAGKTVDIEVPIGVYKLSYACGKAWYGTRHYFGPDTLYYSSDKTLSFYADNQYYNGHTLELWLQSDGNLDRKLITESQFPA